MPPFAQPITDVHTALDAEAAARRLAGRPEIAIDVEADALHAFRARLCYLQVGTDDDILLLDTLAPGVRAAAVAAACADPAVTKFFHAAGNDLQFLAEAGVRVAGLFDTYVAATWLGWTGLGLADLVERFTGVHLAKQHQQADFAQRPLPPELHAYIADDVRYLCAVGRATRAACREADILDEVDLQCRKMAEEALARPATAPLHVRLPQGLSPEARALGFAIAERLHEARLAWAEAEDVPMGQVLPNAAITDLAAQPPSTLRDLARRRGVRGRFLREHGEAVLAMIEALRAQAARGELPLRDAPARPDAQARKREEVLKVFRKEKAAARKVTPWVVLTNAHVEALVADPPRSLDDVAALPWFGAKRLQLYGPALVSLLQPRAR